MENFLPWGGVLPHCLGGTGKFRWPEELVTMLYLTSISCSLLKTVDFHGFSRKRDRRNDGLTDQLIFRPSHRDARTHYLGSVCPFNVYMVGNTNFRNMENKEGKENRILI